MAFLFSAVSWRTLFSLLFFLQLPQVGWAKPDSAKVKSLVIIGDSLTEGYGVSREKAFPALLETKLNESGQKWKVVNAGISGSTSASGMSRLKWQLKSKPDFILIALGANDGLRGTTPESTKKNLSDMIAASQKEKITVILAGMQMPPNYGKSFTQKFAQIFPDLAAQYKVHLIPFLLEKVAGDPTMNLSDGIHPNEKGHQTIADTFYKSLSGVLK